MIGLCDILSDGAAWPGRYFRVSQRPRRVAEQGGPVMANYWVVGGEYTSTRFDRLAEGRTEERYGPFPNYVEAKKEWMRQSWRHVDNCHCRYRIVTANREAA
jgi:Domain of unknown function (DUF4170)